MLKYFSRLLIFTLILTAPLSFTGDRCPDFKPACDLREYRSGRAAAVIGNRQQIGITPSFIAAPFGSESNSPLTLEFHFKPVNASLNLPLHERAPPFIPVVS